VPALSKSIQYLRDKPSTLLERSRYGRCLIRCAKKTIRRRPLCPRRQGSMARTILVADDNPLMRKMLCEIFEAEEDYDICAEASNGREAIDLALKHRPELIILDLSMPVMNGVEASRELKRILPTVPIILFSQYADVGNGLTAVADLQVDRIVSKADVRNLIEHVRLLIPV
jgi:DNA-binding NarL/FixJ family response regulator